MTEQDLFLAADKQMKKIINQIKEDDWDKQMPEGFSARRPDIKLRELINNHAYDEAWVPDVLAGKTAEEVGDKYDGDLLKEDPKGNYNKIFEAAQKAVERLDDPERTVHLSYGDYKAKEYLNHISTYRSFQAWQVGKFIGVNADLPSDVVEGLWEHVMPQVESLRQMGVFSPEVNIDETASSHDKLLAKAGYDPKS